VTHSPVTGDGPTETDGDGGRSGDSDTATDSAVGDDPGAEQSASDPTLTAASRPTQAPPATEEFDWRGWVLVAAVIVSFLVVPWAIIALPYVSDALGSLGLSRRDAYLTLPLSPAVVLASLAVWSAVASRRS